MPKIVFFPLHSEGLEALNKFQESNEIINFRAMRIQDGGNQYGGTWCIAVLYIAKTELQKPESVTNDKPDLDSQREDDRNRKSKKPRARSN